MNNAPFPQANSLERIYELFCTFEEDGMSVAQVAEKYQITNRVGCYYLDALSYIGYLEKYNIKFFLNHEGIIASKLEEKKRRVTFARKVLNHELLGNIYVNTRFIKGKSDKIIYIRDRISEATGLNENTSGRRASTIFSWFDWIDREALE